MLRADGHVFCTRAHVDLASHIIEWTFGSVVAKVAVHLLSHGALTLAELAKELVLPPSQLRNEDVEVSDIEVTTDQRRPSAVGA